MSVLLWLFLGEACIFYLDEWQFGVFGFLGEGIYQICFSDLTGHPDIQVYLLHRLGYFGPELREF